MKLMQRLKYYALGLGFGILFIAVFFNQKSCSSWFPNQRVLTSIHQSIIYINERNECILECNKLSKQTVFKVLTSGDVNFSESDVTTDNKRYRITNSELSIDVLLNTLDSTVKILSINEADICEVCNTKSDKFDRFFNVSEQMILTEFETKPIYFQEKVNCILTCENLSKELFLSKIKTANVDFEKSNITAKPYPIYHLTFDSIMSKVEIGDEQIRIIQLESPHLCNCK